MLVGVVEVRVEEHGFVFDDFLGEVAGEGTTISDAGVEDVLCGHGGFGCICMWMPGFSLGPTGVAG